MKHRFYLILISSVLILSLVFNITACKNEPDLQKTVFTLKYTGEEGGRIVGNVEQAVNEGEDGAYVLAVPNEGYEFVGWSDGLDTAGRTDKEINENKNYTASFAKIIFSLTYSSSQGGRIEGDTEQSVEYGSNGSTVTAVADRGYEFKNWSDGITTEERTDKKIASNKTLTAYFTEYTRDYKLDYKFGELAEGEEKTTTAKLTYTNLKTQKFPVPAREHFTFGGWYIGDDKLTDTDGKVTASEEIINLAETEIYAKWTANETFTYKILLVYVTRIDATLYSTVKKADIYVDYTMSDLEREFCELTTKRLKQYLDEMTDGLVDFQIDEYYTTETITADNFTRDEFKDKYGNTSCEYGLLPKRITETADMLSNYDSTLSVVNMNDYNYPYSLHFASGTAIARYAEINSDSFFCTLKNYNFTLQDAVNALKSREDIDLTTVGLIGTPLMETYWFSVFTHELAHTIEQRLNLYSYHDAVVSELHGKQHYKCLEADKFYYLHEAVMDGEKVGIPYEFWKGDIAKVKYLVSGDKDGSNGVALIKNHSGGVQTPIGSGNLIYDVILGTYVEAMCTPFIGYRFVRWSDGVTTQERTDLISGDFEVTAIFEKIE